MRDASDTPSTMRGYVKPGTAQATALASLSVLAGRVMSISDVVVTAYALTYPAVELHPAAPGATSGLSAGCLLAFRTSDADKNAALFIPGIRDDTLMPDGCFAGVAIDTGNAVVAALVAQLIAGPWSDVFGRDLTALCAAYKATEV